MQTDLFETPPRYPHAPGFAKGRETSRKAAETVWEPSERQKQIMTILWESDNGLTDHELAEKMGLPMCRVQPRRSDLTALGKVIDSGDTRLTPYGKKAVVWQLSAELRDGKFF